jgi:putative nucleotidyltransferase with HDIG domain
MFGVTTRIQLMELAQLSHPLLRELQERAPGTFHHSVLVGNLSERAADLVGADPLLVRVGCYFHDIGKIAHPAFFIENQTEGQNPHDRLSASDSAKYVAEHVRYGLEVTARHRVPARVRAFVPEHHGTRLVTYFYRKASELDPNTDPERFRYPGPRPQSKETAIVMLADSTEAVVRASRDRSHEHIDQLVDSVIAERVAEGQMDDSDLTLRDLKTIGESFKATLRGIYHPRIEYPAPTAAELQTTGAQGIGYLKPPSNPMEPPPFEPERR